MSSKAPAAPLELRMSPAELAVWQTHKALVDRGVLPSCVNCENWSDEHNKLHKADQRPPELCLLYNRRPPAKVIVVGCERHVPMIPF